MRYFGFLGMLLTVFVLTNSSFSLAGGKPPSKGPYNFNDLVTLLHSFPDEQETLHPGTWPRALAPALRSSPDLPLRDIQSLLETFEKLCQEGHVTYRKGGDTVMIYVFEKEALYIRNYFRLQVIEIYLEHMQKRFESKKFSSLDGLITDLLTLDTLLLTSEKPDVWAGRRDRDRWNEVRETLIVRLGSLTSSARGYQLHLKKIEEARVSIQNAFASWKLSRDEASYLKLFQDPTTPLPSAQSIQDLVTRQLVDRFETLESSVLFRASSLVDPFTVLHPTDSRSDAVQALVAYSIVAGIDALKLLRGKDPKKRLRILETLISLSFTFGLDSPNAAPDVRWVIPLKDAKVKLQELLSEVREELR